MTVSTAQQQHRHPRRWTWAHVQQGLRRNCLIGPVAFCLLVVLLLPYAVDNNMELIQRLPLVVEAVPFFRRKAAAFKFRGGAARSGSSSSGTTLGMTAVIAEPETTQAAPVTVRTPSKRKHSQTTADYNFPLVPNPQGFQSDKTAPIPFRYFEAHQRNPESARKAVLNSLQWRRERRIDTILSRPHANYDAAKRVLPHYFIGRSAVTNHVVFVQRPGLADLAVADRTGLVLQDILDQYAYVFEYCWNILHTNTATSMDRDTELMIGVMDLQGLNLGILRKPELINFVKEFVAMIDAHYPTRAYKTYMVNAPGWFSTLYKLISPIMRESTKEKIVLYSAGKAQTAALEAALGKDMAATLAKALRVPDKKEKKSKDKNDLTLTSDILLETKMEQDIRNFVMQRLQQDGLEMKKIVVPSS